MNSKQFAKKLIFIEIISLNSKNIENIIFEIRTSA